MSLVVSYEDEPDKEFYTYIPSSCTKFLGHGSYKYLTYNPNINYPHNNMGRGGETGPQCIVTNPYGVSTPYLSTTPLSLTSISKHNYNSNNVSDNDDHVRQMDWRYQYDLWTVMHRSIQLTSDQIKHMYFKSEPIRGIYNIINLYDFIEFLKYYEQWNIIYLTVTWPKNPINHHNMQTTFMTAHDLLLYGAVWDPVTKTYSVVENHTQWNTFYNNIPIFPTNDDIIERLNSNNNNNTVNVYCVDDGQSEETRQQHSYITIKELKNSTIANTTVVNNSIFELDPYIGTNKAHDEPGMLLRLYPSVYYQVYNKHVYSH